MKRYDRLIFLSGGIDSTFTLYKWLIANQSRENKKQILIHHVNMTNQEGRCEFETRATKAVIDWFIKKGWNNFTFTESSFDYGNLKHIVQDIELIGFMQGVLLRSKKYSVDKVIICASKYDLTLPGYEDRSRRRYNIIKAMMEKDIEFDYPIIELTREEMIKEMPKSLLKLCWFCRKPSSGMPCGECRTCLNTIPYLEARK